jgi:soluble P-type ATPase
MILLDIPGRGVIELHHAVFDLNGTLAIDGMFIPGVPDRLLRLSELLEIHILTAGTHGNIARLEKASGQPFRLIGHGEEKRHYV